MGVFAGTVRNGVIVPKSPEGLVEGTTVSVVANDGEAWLYYRPGPDRTNVELPLFRPFGPAERGFAM